MLAAIEELGLRWVIATSSRQGAGRGLGSRRSGLSRSRRSSTAATWSTPSPRRTCCCSRRSGSGLPAAECWAVGDSTWDIRAAVAAGMPGIGVTAGSAVSEAELREAGAARVVGALGELAELLRAHPDASASDEQDRDEDREPRRGRRSRRAGASERVGRSIGGRRRSRGRPSRSRAGRRGGSRARAGRRPGADATPAGRAGAARPGACARSCREAGHGLVRGERAVGEARRDAGELDERVDEEGRVGGQREDRADADDREHARAEAGGRLERLLRDPERPDPGELGRERVGVVRREEQVRERDPEDGEPQGRDAPRQRPGRERRRAGARR